MCLEWLISTIACWVRGEIVLRASDTFLDAVEDPAAESARPGRPMMPSRRPERGGDERCGEARLQPDRATRPREPRDRGLELFVVPHANRLARRRVGRGRSSE